jgi:hypothetical protein
VSHKNFTYFSFYCRDLIVVFLVFYVHVYHRSRSKEIKNKNYTGPTHYLGYRAVGSSFWLGELKVRAEGLRKFFNLESLKCHFLDSAAPPGCYGLGLHAEMHRVANKDYHSKVLLDIFFVRLFLHDTFFKFELLARYFFGDSTPPPSKIKWSVP